VINRTFLTATTLVTIALSSAGATHASVGQVSYASGPVWAEREGARLALTNQSAVNEGDRILTGPGAVVYVRTQDGGFFILRADSSGRLIRYFTHPTNPAQSEYRLEIEQGTGRVVSGQGPQQARERFRLNTPVAAIGIRGTDFTVTTDQERTRAAVQSGAISLASLGAGCLAGDLGACRTDFALELTPNGIPAAEVNRQTLKPTPVSVDTVIAQPVSTVAPVAKTSTPTSAPTSASDRVQENKASELALSVQRPSPPPVVEAPKAEVPKVVEEPGSLQWGRWKALEQLAPTMAGQALIDAGYRLMALDNTNMILRTPSVAFSLPREGAASFSLQGHEGAFRNQANGQVTAAKVSQASLEIDFASRSFTTALALTGEGGLTAQFSAKGNVGGEGQLNNNPLSLVDIRGALGGNTGSEAAYLYNYNVNTALQVTGTTFWRRAPKP